MIVVTDYAGILDWILIVWKENNAEFGFELFSCHEEW